jgi:hypothetical protein
MAGIGESLAVRLLDCPRFPRPWSIEEREACYVVLDQNGQSLAYVYFAYGDCSLGKLLTRYDALRIAATIAGAGDLF